ncbi:hypothetical protein B0H13DRAFT_1884389 [Mycena leptocephala]|nr:hypothetical protein B0H13DRAFT_1884389 [Mycena leptocephala]
MSEWFSSYPFLGIITALVTSLAYYTQAIFASFSPFPCGDAFPLCGTPKTPSADAASFVGPGAGPRSFISEGTAAVDSAGELVAWPGTRGVEEPVGGDSEYGGELMSTGSKIQESKKKKQRDVGIQDCQDESRSQGCMVPFERFATQSGFGTTAYYQKK